MKGNAYNASIASVVQGMAGKGIELTDDPATTAAADDALCMR
jgi:hypothetical protein